MMHYWKTINNYLANIQQFINKNIKSSDCNITTLTKAKTLDLSIDFIPVSETWYQNQYGTMDNDG